MTTRSRRSGGQAKDEKPTDAEATAGKAQAVDQPEEQRKDGGNAAGDSPTLAQQAEVHDTLPEQGDPVPEQVDAGMVLEETGISPEPFTGTVGIGVPAAGGDTEANGKATAVGTDSSGQLRQAAATPTAAFGDEGRNGAPIAMRDRQIRTEFGNNGEPTAKLLGSGVRGDVGVGTMDRELPEDERPTYPSTTLTRSSSDAAPVEPDDVKLVTEPKLGFPETSTDPIAAAAALPSHIGDEVVELVDQDGNTVKPSEFFSVPDGPAGRTLMVVDRRVSERFTVRRQRTPSQRLLFTQGQEVPVALAQTLIKLHG